VGYNIFGFISDVNSSGIASVESALEILPREVKEGVSMIICAVRSNATDY